MGFWVICTSRLTASAPVSVSALAVFPNGFELDAARHVANRLGIGGMAATEHVESLVHKSMVTANGHPHGLRYRILETMRVFAVERLEELGERRSALSALGLEAPSESADKPAKYINSPESSIYRKREAGMAPHAAAIEGAREVTAPVIAGTMTTIVCRNGDTA